MFIINPMPFTCWWGRPYRYVNLCLKGNSGYLSSLEHTRGDAVNKGARQSSVYAIFWTSNCKVQRWITATGWICICIGIPGTVSAIVIIVCICIQCFAKDPSHNLYNFSFQSKHTYLNGTDCSNCKVQRGITATGWIWDCIVNTFIWMELICL